MDPRNPSKFCSSPAVTRLRICSIMEQGSLDGNEMDNWTDGVAVAERRLFQAAQGRCVDSIRTALSLGARASFKDANRKTALHFLAEGPEIRSLADAVEMAEQEASGKAPPMIEAVEILVIAGCPLDALNWMGASALATAACIGRQAFVSELHRLGARLDGALHFVAKHSADAAMVPVLAAMGSDAFAMDCDGLSALDVARGRPGPAGAEMIAAIELEILKASAREPSALRAKEKPAPRI